MTDYNKLVEALRHYHKAQDCNECAAGYEDEWCDISACIFLDAAAAIEALQDTVQAQDKALKECARQLAKIEALQDRVFELEEWLNDDEIAADDYRRKVGALQAEVEKWQDVAYQDSLAQMKQQERIWELEALKEAHVKPRYGEWLTVEVKPLDRMHNPIYECTCSRCHEEYTVAKIPNYCPNCGSFNKAKMEVQDGQKES